MACCLIGTKPSPEPMLIHHLWDIKELNQTRTTRMPASKWKLQILKNCQKYKFWNFARNFTPHTFWSCLIRCINMKWIQPKLYALQSWHGMRDGRTVTDGQTDGRSETRTTSLCGGYNYDSTAVLEKCLDSSSLFNPLALGDALYAVRAKNMRYIRHFQWLGPDVWWGDFTNWYRIYKAHQTNVWWTMKVFRLHCYMASWGNCGKFDRKY